MFTKGSGRATELGLPWVRAFFLGFLGTLKAVLRVQMIDSIDGLRTYADFSSLLGTGTGDGRGGWAIS